MAVEMENKELEELYQLAIDELEGSGESLII